VIEPNPPRWILAGHSSSQPRELLDDLELAQAEVIVEESSAFAEIDFNACDAFMLVINAKTGVSGAMIELWNRVSDRQIPRMILVNGLELSEIDFDDTVLIINRVLENVVTPYLVLHDEVGEPTGLISIADGLVHDYSGTEEINYKADDELLNLVTEFREELMLALSEMDESAYQQGIVVPALPYIGAKKIGLREIQDFARVLTKR